MDCLSSKKIGGDIRRPRLLRFATHLLKTARSADLFLDDDKIPRARMRMAVPHWQDEHFARGGSFCPSRDVLRHARPLAPVTSLVRRRSGNRP
jgi:hypothetical protein